MKKRLITLTTAIALLLVLACFLVPIRREREVRLDQARELFSYQLKLCHMEGDAVRLEGVFFNENTSYHLARMDFLAIFINDKQGNRIATYFLSEEDQKNLRIPPMTNTAWNCIAIPLNPAEARRAIEENDLHVTMWMEPIPGSCTGDDCAWCWGERTEVNS